MKSWLLDLVELAVSEVLCSQVVREHLSQVQMNRYHLLVHPQSCLRDQRHLQSHPHLHHHVPTATISPSAEELPEPP